MKFITVNVKGLTKKTFTAIINVNDIVVIYPDKEVNGSCCIELRTRDCTTDLKESSWQVLELIKKAKEI